MHSHAADVHAAEAKHITIPSERHPTLSRRHFVAGVAGVAALAMIGGGVAWGNSQSSSDTVDTLTVPADAVTAQDSLQAIENLDDALTMTTSAKLPTGSLVWCNDDEIAACLVPSEESSPLTTVAVLNLSTGETTTVLEKAVGSEEGFEIFDVRANSAGVVWLEADILEDTWRLYAATLSGTTLGEPQKLDEGDADWEMPTMATSSTYAYWQRLPLSTGNAITENSTLNRAAFGSATSEIIYSSEGRMACAVQSYGDGIVSLPRARSSSTNYQMTRFDGATGKPLNACILPSSMKPMDCNWGKTGFSFCFDGSYDYGEGIAKMGTYAPYALPDAATLDAQGYAAGDDTQAFLEPAVVNADTEAFSSAKWFNFNSTPLSAPSWCGNWLMLRGSTYVCAIDLTSNKYAQISLEEGSGEYKDFLASTHIGKRAVTFCDIDHTPLEGDTQQYCLVRIWESATS